MSDVSEEIVRYATKCSTECNLGGHSKYDAARDILLFSTTNRWTIVLWPEFFNVHDIPVCAYLSHVMQTLVSTIHTYDSDYWVHVLIDRGEILDRFASVPDYFTDNDQVAETLRLKWRGNPQLISRIADINPAVIQPYFVHVGTISEDYNLKAFEEDEFSLTDFWVFVDFWRHMGIRYPDDISKHEQRIRLGAEFPKRLPIMEDEL